MRPAALRVAASAIGVALAGAGLFALREATISRSVKVPRPSTIVVTLEAESRGGESASTLPERVEALLLTCRIEARSDLTGPVEQLDDRHFRATFAPTMDPTDQRQFRGCVEDWLIDGVQAEIESMEEFIGVVD